MTRVLAIAEAAVALIALPLPRAFADGGGCAPVEALSAEVGAGSIRSWRGLYVQARSWYRCDDGAIAEGFSESVTILLADKWQDLAELEMISRADLEFRRFVLRHIDDTIPVERLSKIFENATQRCEQGPIELCEDIASIAAAMAGARLRRVDGEQ
jgi:hypothetical protein